MRTIKKISAILLIWVLSISNIFATGFPDEPMIIYGNITGNQTNLLKIYDGSNTLLQEATITSGKYGTDKTFNNTEKIKLPDFNGTLIFKNGEKTATVTKGEITSCENSAIFQKGHICEYNLSFKVDTPTEPEIIPEFNADSLVIKEELKAELISDIFSGKIFKKTKTNITKQSLKNLFKNVGDDKEVILLSKELKIQKNISKNLVIISGDEKQSLFLSENTGINEEDVIIQKPQKVINTSDIKNKINKKIIGAVKIPTNKPTSFKKSIRICTELITSHTKQLQVFYSQDESNWYKDTSANGLEVSDGQVCFYTNHLTSFAIGEDITSSNNNHSNSGGGGYSNIKKKKNNLISSNSKKQNLHNSSTPVISSNPKNKSNFEKSSTIQNNYDGKKYIFTEIKIDSKTYIRNLKTFRKTSELKIDVSGHKVIKLKGNIKYNKQIDLQALQIFNDIKLRSIRESMFNHMNKMNTIYGILLYNELDEGTKEIYTKQLKIAQNNFIFKLKKLKFKDIVVRKALEKRRIQNEK